MSINLRYKLCVGLIYIVNSFQIKYHNDDDKTYYIINLNDNYISKFNKKHTLIRSIVRYNDFIPSSFKETEEYCLSYLLFS